MMHIHSSGHVSSNAKLGNNVKIDLFSIVHDSVVIRDRVRINSYCEWHLKGVGISGASSHSGRRSFITALSGKGISVRVLAALAGHRSLSSILPYIDASDDMKRQAVELIG